MIWLTPRPGTACTGGMIWCPEAASRPSDELRSVTGIMPGLLWSPNSPGANSPLSPCPRPSRGRMNLPVYHASAMSLAQMIDEAAPQSGGMRFGRREGGSFRGRGRFSVAGSGLLDRGWRGGYAGRSDRLPASRAHTQRPPVERTSGRVPRGHRTTRHRGFTLIELMASYRAPVAKS